MFTGHMGQMVGARLKSLHVCFSRGQTSMRRSSASKAQVRYASAVAVPFLFLTAGVVANDSHEQEEMLMQDLLLRMGAPAPSLLANAANKTQQHVIDMAASAATTTTTTSEDESCFSGTFDACLAEGNCLMCAATGPDYCESIVADDCESYWDLLCCTYGHSDACQENALIIDLVGRWGTILVAARPVLYMLGSPTLTCKGPLQ